MKRILFLILTLAVVAGCQKEQLLEEVTPVDIETSSASYHMAPNFITELKDVDVRVGQRIHLEVRVEPETDPTMQITWYRNGHPVHTSARVRPYFDFGYASLDILSALPEDSGQYTCKARSSYGEDTTSCNVRVGK